MACEHTQPRAWTFTVRKRGAEERSRPRSRATRQAHTRLVRSFSFLFPAELLAKNANFDSEKFGDNAVTAASSTMRYRRDPPKLAHDGLFGRDE